MNFSKDIVLKSDGRISFFPNHFFSFKKLPQTFALLLFPWPVSSLAWVFMMRWPWYAGVCSNVGNPRESLRWATLRGFRRFYKKKWPSARDFDTYRISNASLCISYVRDSAVKSGSLATICIISHTHFLMLFLQAHFSFKNRRKHSPWCSFHDLFSLHFLLTNTDAHSDSDHQCFSLLWATLRAIRRCCFFFN